VIDDDLKVNQMIDEEKADLDLEAGQEIEIEVEKNQEIEAKNHEKMTPLGIDDHDQEIATKIESLIEIDDRDLILEKEKLKMKHLWIHFVLLIKQLKMTKEVVAVVINLDLLQVLPLLLTRIMTHQKPKELVPVLEAVLLNASHEVEHQSAVHVVEVAVEVEIVEIEVVQEKNRAKESNDQNVQDQVLGQGRKKNEKHQQKI